ncbi:MAG: transcriptional regulator [Micavibrio aeruginosavorus]|uniref:Transcriptional regulator n=1 Tax=Micavibrio aeruginosavorus TaxID=349221 RepID=A0A2W5MWN1_9BACT|nr:MAG: transcriptional regulator [Micavibrio aeruginosavorus]
MFRYSHGLIYKKNPKSSPAKIKKRSIAIDVQVGSMLRQARLLKGISQHNLAKTIGVTFQQIQKYESGVNRISAGRIYQIAQTLEVPVGFFFPEYSESKGKIGAVDQKSYAKSPDMNSAESINLIRIYYSVKQPDLRKYFLQLITELADNLAKRK